MAKKRMSPADLVSKSTAYSKNKTWFSTLSAPNKRYVKSVADAIVATPAASVTIVARKLKEELEADASEQTIVRALKGLM